ncbi:MAG TPA: MerR family transcriptional regulator [Intrasporangium sp.]|nr:MerR family transcriptional regulator [Intrasporangium sp.]
MSAGHPDGPGARGGLTIGQVLEQLHDEFPDVTTSKVRFLEAQGLVTPERTPAGYRLFSSEDLERLRYVLTAQRDRFWPLKVIRESLDALDRGLPDPGADSVRPHPSAPSPPSSPSTPSSAPALLRAETVVPRGRVRLTGPQLREASGIDKPLFSALESFGLLRADATGHFVAEAVDVAVAAKRLAEHGLEPRHLRPFRTAADREIGLVDQVLATRRDNGSREERTAEILSACIALHTALVRTGLAR